MSFKEKTIAVTLVNFSLILVFFLRRVYQLVQTGEFNADNLFSLWGWVIVLAIVVSIVGIIVTLVVPAVVEAIRTGDDDVDIDDVEDERDQLIDLRGTKVTHTISSFGSLIAMMTFVLGQPPLVMFALLIFFGVLAQIIGDVSRLYLYRRGF